MPSRYRWGLFGVVAVIFVQPASGATAERLSAAARQGPSPSLCKMDTSRGSVPGAFALQGCVTLSGIWMRNSRSIPVQVSTSGAVGARQVVTAANVTIAADVTWGVRGNRGTLLMPGQTVYYPVGSGAGSATIRNDHAAANVYIVADGLLAVLGGTKFGDKFKNSGNANAAVGLVTELTDVLSKYHNCATGASFLKRAGCDAILARDVAFALGRFSFSVGKSALSKTASLVIAAAHQWWFDAHLNGDLDAISNGHGTITLAAVPQPQPQPQPKPQPQPVPQPQPQPGPPPQPQPQPQPPVPPGAVLTIARAVSAGGGRSWVQLSATGLRGSTGFTIECWETSDPTGNGGSQVASFSMTTDGLGAWNGSNTCTVSDSAYSNVRIGPNLIWSNTLAPKPPPDTAPPTFTGLPTVVGQTTTSVTLSWSAATDNLGVTGYRVFIGNSQIATAAGLTYTFNGLRCASTYLFGVAAYDAAGNVSATASVLAATASCGTPADTTAPSAPGGLSASNVSVSSLRLNWAASTDNVGVTGYDTFLNGAKIGATTGLFADFSGLVCGTTYGLGIAARDAAGNVSSTSSISAATSACPAPVRVNAYDNYGAANAGHAMCRGNPGNSLSMPGGTASETFTVPGGVAAIDQVLVQIDPDSTVTGHGSLSVNGSVRATADATAAGDTTFNFSRVAVSPGDQVTFSVTFSATYGKIITVYTAGSPGGTFTASNSCPDGAPSLSTSSTGLRAVVRGWDR